MKRRIGLRLAALAGAAVLAAGCASTQDVRERERQTQARINQILDQSADPNNPPEARRCLEPQEFQQIDVLDSQRIVFEGSGGEYWLNTLRTHCADLLPGSDLRRGADAVRRPRGAMNSFQFGDWFSGPWHRNLLWPWYGVTGIHCNLGEFQPVTAAQVDAIKAALRDR
jgi:hypothetical protein